MIKKTIGLTLASLLVLWGCAPLEEKKEEVKPITIDNVPTLQGSTTAPATADEGALLAVAALKLLNISSIPTSMQANDSRAFVDEGTENINETVAVGTGTATYRGSMKYKLVMPERDDPLPLTFQAFTSANLTATLSGATVSDDTYGYTISGLSRISVLTDIVNKVTAMDESSPAYEGTFSLKMAYDIENGIAILRDDGVGVKVVFTSAFSYNDSGDLANYNNSMLALDAALDDTFVTVSVYDMDNNMIGSSVVSAGEMGLVSTSGGAFSIR